MGVIPTLKYVPFAGYSATGAGLTRVAPLAPFADQLRVQLRELLALDGRPFRNVLLAELDTGSLRNQ